MATSANDGGGPSTGPSIVLPPIDPHEEARIIRGHLRSHSTPSSPTIPRGTRVLGALNEEGSDADVEETADEAAAEGEAAKVKKKRRRMRRPKMLSPSTQSGEPDSPVGTRRLKILQRRATMPDTRNVLSEGEGRDHLARENGWGRGSSWMGRPNDGDDPESPSGVARRGPGHVRRISMFHGGISDGGEATPRRPFFGADRASTYGAQKWRQVKSTLKLLRKPKDNQFDFHKSAELMAELRAGAPAVLMLASMIQRDEHGNKRIPVLLEQLRLRVTDSAPLDGEGERHWLFTIELEYGSGPSRMCWTVKRTIREILNLHWKYKLGIDNKKYSLTLPGTRPRQPRFPTSVFPYVRGLRGVDDEEEDNAASVRGDGDETAGYATGGEGTAAEGTDVEERGVLSRRGSRITRPNTIENRHKQSTTSLPGLFNPNPDNHYAGSTVDAAQLRRRYVEKQRKMLEKYLQETVRWLMFRADSNRLCRFLELSALGVRLAAEGSYHGKECFLHIQSAKGIDFRRVLTPGAILDRHSRKWFLVRQSYIVCVESPENMNIYDVYLVDSKFRINAKMNKLREIAAKRTKKDKGKEQDMDLSGDQAPEKHHRVNIMTSERKIKLWSRNQHLIQQFEESINGMLAQTPWHRENRFGSFAPVRQGVFAQWLVDGRDYMWNVSRAINMAKDVIYIHDWWLSPEIYMRRPPCISQKWRLDRLLQRKAEEGVKIFIIIYRNVQQAIPIDSEYTKHSLLNLHPNIFVQRSPHQFKKNQFFFAHHEKICIVDHIVAFVGGIDLCFGRWDTPQHPVADDKLTGFEPGDYPKDTDHTQVFPGKDYSNARVLDFFRLNAPYEEMYDRSRVPRMPWHDVAMQVVGQPARDLTRHFVQRWNYIRRGRKPTRPTPFLLPPPDCRKEELEDLGLTGTCEVQILRSAANWSLGITETEASIQAAYLRLIRESDHFVYMENQFFVTGGECMNVQFVNGVADAIVERIMKAHANDEEWRCVILIPLLPGFEGSVAEQDGSSVRLIMQCQFRSICRGESSIFGRLRANNIEPEDYIQFFSLRQWGHIGPNKTLVTEQLYIHAKIIIVDDRIALIGSANINERSLLGTRDSECAAVVRDKDMIWSTMAGRPYQVGRFAHTLRLRLMREHLGLDVDEIQEQERQLDPDHEDAEVRFSRDMENIYGSDSEAGPSVERPKPARSNHNRLPSFNHDVDWDMLNDEDNLERSSSKQNSVNTEQSAAQKREANGHDLDHWKSAESQGLDLGRDSVIVNGKEVLTHNVFPEGKGTMESPKGPEAAASTAGTEQFPAFEETVSNDGLPPAPSIVRRTTEQMGLPRPSQLPSLPVLDDTDIGGPPASYDADGKLREGLQSQWAYDIRPAHIDKDCMRDPLNPSFYDDIWSRVAENNSKIYRRVFHCMPDSEVTNWHEYQEFLNLQGQFEQNMEAWGPDIEAEREHQANPHKPHASGGAGIGAPAPTAVASGLAEKVTGHLPIGNDSRPEEAAPAEKPEMDLENEKRPLFTPNHSRQNSRLDREMAAAAERALHTPKLEIPMAFPEKSKTARDRRPTFATAEKPGTGSSNNASHSGGGTLPRRKRGNTRASRRGFQPDQVMNKPEAEEMLGMLQGTLVQFPYDWLVVEESNGNWLYQADLVAPLQIYN
ncbi:hypothetical protein MCOR27_001253 [Pyricularia oryzae]|uniref:phospholipase D n=5 Tax=Pyricularia TaxID=48558 RepID=A0ABQ8NGU0_PYRGI|nr:phospholipase D1 [Pyricularia oryzae 70-15]ELQ40051.1 phospholipase D1 [Pyricularia oryzae Y34]KAH8840380.1 hypothetical protein MCOR01_007091 [Pyricularia oryzae]KAI6296846.1 hypothetical protein MCOR33_006651 [Pyricularia grisea]EHA48406.1 phospholipase D1 [Pyricularia oryzae 70-15]KAI6256979.1 hypothetical protein MCOR19_006561 [Pyricularia oryzae]